MIRRWMYGDRFENFLRESDPEILGQLAMGSAGAVEESQRNAWASEIKILKSVLIPESYLAEARIYFELSVPRLGRRADVALLIGHVLFILEFKVGERAFNRSAKDQAWDYGLDYKNFHAATHNIAVLPILIATEAAPEAFKLTADSDQLGRPVCVAPSQIGAVLESGLSFFHGHAIDARAWEEGRYLPTPTIVEAARALYAGHSVEEISRSDAGARNLMETAKAVDRIIEGAKVSGKKVICFVTGVPGAGKTLVGLDVANRHQDASSATYSVFLSGNGPLVAVLREALTRDQVRRSKEAGNAVRVGNVRTAVGAFIQNVHHFRDEYLKDDRPPPEHVVLFDEAQRAWDLAQTSAFMARKKGLSNFKQSEPEFLISCLDRHKSWAVVVCLVGGGQEINTGEGGIGQWFSAILEKFNDWEAYLSPKLAEAEYQAGDLLEKMRSRPETKMDPGLHLGTSMRSFRAESVSHFVRDVLALEVGSAKKILADIADRYPIVLTRDLANAKAWLKEKARGSERYGIVVSSQAERLRPHAIDVRVKTDPVRWFLDDKDDVRSSFYLEDVATEFQVQGLELDWACVVWDGDMRFSGKQWSHHEFRGSKWINIGKAERKRYLENAYRVLMTRARQGMVIVVPNGSDEDPTRAHQFYDPTFNYLRDIGIQVI